MKTDCTCLNCQNLCFNSCGWFGTIEEVEGAAKLMGMSVKDFAHEFLIREWWSGDDDISIPAPRKNFNKCSDPKQIKLFNELFLLREEKYKNGKGFVKASWGHNLMSGWACIFLDDDNKCLIHASKPIECRKGFGCDLGRQPKSIIREKLPAYWKKHQDWIEGLV